MKLQTKIILSSTLLLFVLLTIANSSIYFIFKKTLTDDAIQRLQVESNHIMEGLKQADITSVNGSNLLRAYLPPNGMIRILPKNGDPQLTTVKDQPNLQSLPYTYISKEQTTVKKVNNHLYAVTQTPIIWTNGDVVSLEVTESLTDVEHSLRLLRMILLFASLVILLPTILGSRLLSKLILLPIQSLIQTMEEIQKAKVLKKITRNTSSKDELDQMATTFNSMMDLLEENYKRQEQFVSDASHELKTPLTVIESYANMLKRWGMNRPDILEEAIEAIHSESIRMKQLTEQMLLLAKDNSEWELNKKPIDIAAICHKIAKHLQLAFHRNISIHVNTEQPIILADVKKVKQLLIILMDNAIKYSEKPIDITITRDKSSLFIGITDYGIGIPKEDLTHVYERFFRVDKARNREKGGSGLGLAIAKKIVAAHHSKIHIDSEEGKGTTVTIEFPI